MALNIATTSDAGDSDTVSFFSRHVNKYLVAFLSTISTKYFSNFLGTREPSCLLPHELCFRSSSLQTPATHRTIYAVHSRVADKGLNFRHLPRTGILGMFMNEVFLHFHLQLVALYTNSDLWLNSLCFPFADFSWVLHSVFNKGEKSSLGGLPARSSGCISILHTSEVCFVIFKTEVPHCSVGSCSRQIHCEPFTESQPRRT